MNMTTIKDVASEAGVSSTAVSFVMNRKNLHQVNDKTRRRILKVAEELGYYPNAVGRSLALKRTETIGVALYDLEYISMPHFSTIIGGVGHSVGSYDYNMHFTITNRLAKGGRKNLHFISKVRQGRLDGLVIIDQAVLDSEILELRKTSTPFVLVDRDIAGEEVHFVMVDNKAGMFQAAEHLIKLGHKRIAFLREPLRWYCVRQMLAGYNKALAKHGLEFDENLVKEINRSPVDPAAVLSELWSLPAPPTAILSSADQIAMAVIASLRKAGKRVPEDVAVVGHGDIASTGQAIPELTSIRVPSQQIGEKAGDLLLGILNGKVPEDRGVVLQPELIVRGSSGEPVAK